MLAEHRRALEVAHASALEVGRFLLGAFGTVKGRPKADGTLVSAADLEADARLTRALCAAFPADEIVSEEGGTRYAGARRVWIVDPLDGTSNYCQGVPIWGVTLALVEDGRPVVGVSHFPTLDLTFAGVRGAGAWEGNRRLHAGGRGAISPDDLIAHCSQTLTRFELQLGGRERIFGSSALNYALVAAGAARASIEITARLWDLAAGWLLIEEAGGAIDTLGGPAVWPLEAADYGVRTYQTLAAGSAELLATASAGVRPRAAV
jgi:myo-inositol-1(or 4)-monophosphatase